MSAETVRRSVLPGFAFAAGLTFLVFGTGHPFRSAQSSAAPPVSDRSSARPGPEVPETIRLSPGSSETLIVPAATVASMRLTSAPAVAAKDPRPLRLTGQLTLDANRLVHVHTRFGGEVIQVGASNRPDRSQLRAGDAVKKGDLLAILWSREIGEKKSDLVDALSSLALHETIYRHLKSIDNTGAVAQRSIEEMRRNYESDLILVERLRRTLRSWRLDESEIKEIEAEASRIHNRASAGPDSPSDKRIEKGEAAGVAEESSGASADMHWAEIEIRAPLDGIILEKNLTVGDIVSTDDDLFKIADLARLVVMTNVYEEDLPALSALPAEKRDWSVSLTSLATPEPMPGRIESIGHVIDPNQHTAVAQGWVNNPGLRLRVGQFVEAVVPIAAAADEVEVPISALIDDGERKFVFIARTPDLTTVERRVVEVRRRTSRTAFLPDHPPKGVEAGERVLTRCVLELSAVLDDLRPPDAP